MKSNQRSKRVLLIFIVIAMFASLSAKVSVPAGTLIFLKPNFPISSAKVKSGQSIVLINKKDVVVNGAVVIRAGARGTGRVVTVSRKSILGIPGKVSIEATSIKAVDGQDIRIQASVMKTGEDNLASALVISFFCCFGILMNGGDAVINLSTELNAITVSTTDVNVSLSSENNLRKDKITMVSIGMDLTVEMKSGNLYKGSLFSIKDNILMLKTKDNMLKINLYNSNRIVDRYGNNALNAIMTKGNIISTENIDWSRFKIKEVE